jgi:nucleotide-binding universal stress UspA family protein
MATPENHRRVCGDSHLMLNSVLLHFSSVQNGEPIIELGVGLARRSAARLRGLTLVDTRRLASLSATSEAAIYTDSEYSRLHQVEAQHDSVRSRLSQACVSAGIDFDIRRVRGNPLEVLPPEAQFHDLVVTSLPRVADLKSEGSNLAAGELIDLLFQGVQPLLVLRDSLQPLRRVLLVSDGTGAAARAIREFLRQNLIPEADLRLLAVGSTEQRARNSLREMVDYCRSRRATIESGWICGSPRNVVIPYALKWGADLVVLGVSRKSRMVRRLFGDPAQRILEDTNLALYGTA